MTLRSTSAAAGDELLARRAKVDARPVRLTQAATHWDSAIAVRDDILAAMRGVLSRESIEAAVLASATGNYPPWVTLEAWLPPPDAEPQDQTDRERVKLEIVVDVKPFNKHPIVTTVRLDKGKKRLWLVRNPQFGVKDAEEWSLYAIDRGSRPRGVTLIRSILRSLGQPFLSMLAPAEYNPVLRVYKTPILTGNRLLAAAALLVAAAGGYAVAGDSDGGIGWLLLLAGVAGLIAAGVVAVRRKRAVCVPPQSAVAPRDLGLVDSWHSVVPGLGRDFEKVKRRLVDRVAEGERVGLSCRTELYIYRTATGFEERERLVVSKGQALAHVHVYQFSEDAFVGWDAYLNWSQWGETAPAAVRVEDGRAVEFRELRTAFYLPNQFDLMDLNGLSEWVHRRLEQEIKKILKEYEIDQEIDFRIIRGDREGALDKSKREGKSAPRKGLGWGKRAVEGANR
jgi:hypothetical protein